MDEKEEVLIKVATKLDILITDFQRHRNKQEENWKLQRDHVLDEEKQLGSLSNQLRWHAVIGGTAISVLIYHVVGGGGLV